MAKRSLLYIAALVSIFFLLFHHHSASPSASSRPVIEFKTSPYPDDPYNTYNTDDVSAFLDHWVTEWYIGPELDEDEFEGFFIKSKSYNLFKLEEHDLKSSIEVPKMKPTMAVLNDVTEIQNDAIHYPHSPVRKVRNPHAKPASEVPKKLSYWIEIEIVCSFLIVFTINYFTGKRENENLALAWTTKFAGKESILEKNFSSLGVGDMNNLLLRERQNVFKLYASGRRFCSGLLATIELKSRHNLISRFYNMAVSHNDEITIEVAMNDDAMDQVVFALARQKLAKRMQKKARDLQRFAGMVTPPGGRKWVAEELQVVSESKEVAGDLITKTALHRV